MTSVRAVCLAAQMLCYRSQFLGGTGLPYQHGCSAVLIQKVVAMLAEIFMVRLEAAARALKETVPSSTSRFVSFTRNSQFTFKESRHRLSEAVREYPTAR